VAMDCGGEGIPVRAVAMSDCAPRSACWSTGGGICRTCSPFCDNLPPQCQGYTSRGWRRPRGGVKLSARGMDLELWLFVAISTSQAEPLLPTSPHHHPRGHGAAPTLAGEAAGYTNQIVTSLTCKTPATTTTHLAEPTCQLASNWK
jgi:hypothetical protein